MAKNDARKSFVAARLKETGKEATPEQRAKFRERFNQLSQTKEGRTTIAQKVLPGGTAAERKALKGSIRPPQTDTTSNKTDYPGFVNKGYSPGILNNVNLPSNNFSSSAPIPSTTTTVPKTTTTTTVPRSTTTTTTVPRFKALESFGIQPGTKNETSQGSVKNDLKKALNWLGKGMPGTDEWKAKDRSFSAADLPLGTGNIYTGIKETKKGNYVGGIARTLAGVGELAINILSTKGGGSYEPIKPNITYPKTGLEMPKLPSYVGGEVALGGKAGANQRVAARAQNTALAKELIAAGKLKVPSSKTPAPVFGSIADQRAAAAAKNAFIGPVLPRPVFGSVKDQRAATGTAPTIQPSYRNPLELTTVPVNPPKSTVSKPKVTKPKTTTPVTTPVTTPAASNRPPTALENKLSDLVSGKKTPVTTPAASVSPPVTTPMTYDASGTRVGGDAAYKALRPGDPKPIKPRYSKSTDTNDRQIDYEIRLADYNKYNPKKK